MHLRIAFQDSLKIGSRGVYGGKKSMPLSGITAAIDFTNFIIGSYHLLKSMSLV
ncbi:MAG: hypothetical protein PHC50_07795 [Candidatus Cloacimonetes bacterium]|nr:hypothetical protein [Candidatus Cloacimonadota bacterium]